MHAGDVLLWAAFAAGILAVIMSLLKLFLMPDLDRRVFSLLAVITFALVSASFVVLVDAFLSSDMTIEYVHSYSATDHEWYYKLTGVWAGGTGSVFLWTFFLSMFVFIQVSVWNLRSGEKRASERYQDWLFLIEAVLLVLFILFVLRLELFSPTPPGSLSLAPQGRGLNPLLETPWMIVHPPVEFAAYAFTAILFAASIAFLASNDEKWKFDALTYGRLSWLFMTLGIIIGALWAYMVLGWGGYWAWDPVETANLLPWISLTAFLHAAFMYRRKGSYRNLAPLLGIISFALVLFTTFETRSGFVDSIHAFAGGGAEVPFDPADKLIFLLENSPESVFFISVMLVTILLGAIFFLWRFLRTERGEKASGVVAYAYIIAYVALLIPIVVDVTGFLSAVFDISRAIGLGNMVPGLAILLLILVGGPFIWVVWTAEVREEKEDSKKRVLTSDTWVMLTILTLSVWFVATFLLMMQGINGLRPESFETRLPLILIPLGAILILCLSWGHVSPGFSFYVVGLIVATTIVGFVIFTNSRYFFVYIPVSLGILTAAGYKIAKVSSKKATSMRLKMAGLFLILTSILGMMMWGSGPSRIWLGPFSFETNLLMIFGGFVASVIPFVAGVNTMRGGGLNLSMIGGILGLVSIGFVAGLVLSAVALVLIITERDRLSRSASWRDVRRPLMTAGAHLIHVGAAVLIIGYATSTFLPTTFEGVTLSMGQSPETFESYQIGVVDSRGLDSNADGFYEIMEVNVRISDSGGAIASVPLRMKWLPLGTGNLGPHYASDVSVHSEHTVDIYFIVLGFYTTSDGWVSVRNDSSGMFVGSSVTDIAVDIEFIPLVGFVWSGAWIMSTGIVMRTASDRWPIKGKERAKEPTLKTDEEYDELLERELQMLEES